MLFRSIAGPMEMAQEIALPSMIVGGPAAVGRTAGFVRRAAEKAGKIAETIEKIGVKPTLPQVLPESAGVLQRAEAKLGSTRYSDILAQQQQDIERQIAALPGGSSVTPPSVQDVYKNAVELLGAPEVQGIISKSTSKQDAIKALSDAIAKMESEAKSVGQAKAQALRAGQTKIKEYIKSTEASVEPGAEALAKRAQAGLPAMEQAAVGRAFPAGTPKKYEPTPAGYELENLIGGRQEASNLLGIR